jgi:hypothetical protein
METAAAAAGRRKAYAALNQGYSSDEAEDDDEDEDEENANHPNPLRSNPSDLGLSPRPSTPYQDPRPAKAALTEISLNDRRVSASGDITDAKPAGGWVQARKEQIEMKKDEGDDDKKKKRRLSFRYRNSSIQPESDFYSKPYGELKPATPPVTDLALGSSRRQVSSSSGVDIASGGLSTFGRRNVSGKIAEEGMARR